MYKWVGAPPVNRTEEKDSALVVYKARDCVSENVRQGLFVFRDLP